MFELQGLYVVSYEMGGEEHELAMVANGIPHVMEIFGRSAPNAFVTSVEYEQPVYCDTGLGEQQPTT